MSALNIPRGQGRAREKNEVDVVFCVDFSGSMSGIIDAIKNHIGKFVDSLTGSNSSVTDARIGLVMHCGGLGSYDILHLPLSSDIAKFRNTLGRYQTHGNEITIPALDVAVELIEQGGTKHHKVIILFTDEPFSGQDDPDYARSNLNLLIQKINERGFMLFMVYPTYDSEYQEFANAINRNIQFDISSINSSSQADFIKFMEFVGKSISQTKFLESENQYSVKGPLYTRYDYTRQA
jgi:Mg-chelatase subunit ChlD